MFLWQSAAWWCRPGQRREIQGCLPSCLLCAGSLVLDWQHGSAGLQQPPGFNCSAGNSRGMCLVLVASGWGQPVRGGRRTLVTLPAVFSSHRWFASSAFSAVGSWFWPCLCHLAQGHGGRLDRVPQLHRAVVSQVPVVRIDWAVARSRRQAGGTPGTRCKVSCQGTRWCRGPRGW